MAKSVCVSILITIFLISCGNKDEERLGFGITKQQADKMLVSGSPSYTTDASECPPVAAKPDNSITVNRIDDRYYLNNKSGKKILTLVFNVESEKDQVLGWKYFSEDEESLFGKLKLNASQSTQCFSVKENLKQAKSNKANFVFIRPPSLKINSIKAFTSLSLEMDNCKFQSKIELVNKSYKASQEDPANKKKFGFFLKALLQVIKVEACMRSIDSAPVPIYYYCGYEPGAACDETSPRLWFRYLSSKEEQYDGIRKLLDSSLFQNNLRETESEFRRR